MDENSLSDLELQLLVDRAASEVASSLRGKLEEFERENDRINFEMRQVRKEAKVLASENKRLKLQLSQKSDVA